MFARAVLLFLQLLCYYPSRNYPWRSRLLARQIIRSSLVTFLSPFNGARKLCQTLFAPLESRRLLWSGESRNSFSLNPINGVHGFFVHLHLSTGCFENEQCLVHGSSYVSCQCLRNNPFKIAAFLEHMVKKKEVRRMSLLNDEKNVRCTHRIDRCIYLTVRCLSLSANW